MGWRPRVSAVLAVGVVAAAGFALAPAGAEPGPGASVETLPVTFVDDSRPTDATVSVPAQAQRTLATTITYPVGIDGPMPLIVLAHGHNGHPSKFTELVGAWAAAGYVVAAPAFPLTNNTVPGGSNPGDVANQPADLSFVIDEVLRMARPGAGGSLAGLVDERRIGAAGLSLGGGTVYGLVFNTCCRDKRIDAAVLMSTVRVSFENGEDAYRHVPALLLHGDADPQYRTSENAYPRLATPKWFVTLDGSTHSGPFEDTPDPADAAVPAITVAFWDRYLKGERSARARLVDAVGSYGRADLQRDLQ